MGLYLFDQYTLLHFSVGVIAYFWGITFFQTFLIHTIFEVVENSAYGMNIINTVLKGVWPGGKPYADSLINNIGDTIGVLFGWVVASLLNRYYNNLNLLHKFTVI